MKEKNKDKNLVCSFPIPFTKKSVFVYAKPQTIKEQRLMAAGCGFMIAGICIMFLNPILSISALLTTLGLYEMGRGFGIVNEC